MNNSDSPAMPSVIKTMVASSLSTIEPMKEVVSYTQGLTKREHFAAMAMQGMLSSGDYGWSAEEFAMKSVRQADELLSELSK